MDLTKHGETCLTELLRRSAEHEAGVRQTARRLGIDAFALQYRCKRIAKHARDYLLQGADPH